METNLEARKLLWFMKKQYSFKWAGAIFSVQYRLLLSASVLYINGVKHKARRSDPALRKKNVKAGVNFELLAVISEVLHLFLLIKTLLPFIHLHHRYTVEWQQSSCFSTIYCRYFSFYYSGYTVQKITKSMFYKYRTVWVEAFLCFYTHIMWWNGDVLLVFKY